jgi:hypothetical protein
MYSPYFVGVVPLGGVQLNVGVSEETVVFVSEDVPGELMVGGDAAYANEGTTEEAHATNRAKRARQKYELMVGLPMTLGVYAQNEAKMKVKRKRRTTANNPRSACVDSPDNLRVPPCVIAF